MTSGHSTWKGTDPKKRPHKYKDCAENVYYNSNSGTLLSTDAATNEWYGGNNQWDYDNGSPLSTATLPNKAHANKFANMIWKGTNFKSTHKVGIAITSNLVMAWYCPDRTKPATTTKEYQMNVCKSDGTCVDPIYLCTKDGYDKCYNEMALKAHNEKRKSHCATAYKFDKDMAMEMQTLLAAN